jgi:hypothetical protein
MFQMSNKNTITFCQKYKNKKKIISYRELEVRVWKQGHVKQQTIKTKLQPQLYAKPRGLGMWFYFLNIFI